MSLGRLTADLRRIRSSLVGYSRRGCALLAPSAACTASGLVPRTTGLILGRPMNYPGWGRRDERWVVDLARRGERQLGEPDEAAGDEGLGQAGADVRAERGLGGGGPDDEGDELEI